MARSSKEGLLSALYSDDFPAQGKWLVVSASINVQGASLVHHLHGWTQRQLDNAWAQLKEPYVVRRGFGKICGTSAKSERQAVGTTHASSTRSVGASEGRKSVGGAKHADYTSLCPVYVADLSAIKTQYHDTQVRC